MPAVKPIPASELYAGQDMTRIIGPDLFNKIVPMAVTESSSVYEEEKARLLRAEAEKVETANGEMDAALDYLKLPGSLAVLKGQSQEEGQADREVERHCQKIAANGSLRAPLEKLKDDRTRLLSSLDQCTTQLDAEESACEKLRVKYGADWTQQPSSVFATTLRKEVKAYRDSIKDAAANDDALLASYKKAEQVIEEMHGAGAKNEVDVMFQEALFKMAESSGRRTSTASATTGNLLDDVDDSNAVNEQIAQLEELCKKLMLVKKDRTQVLKDLREKIHADDISQVLVLNKKNLSGQEAQIFQAELEKFRPHQTRLRQADTKQTSLLKEVTKLYGELLQDSRVRAEQQKHETMLRQRSAVVSKYEEAYKTYKEVSSVLGQAQGFYAGIEKDVDSLSKNVEEFVSNRKAEGMRLLQELERKKETQSAAQDDHERQKLNALMSRLSVSSGPGSPVVGSPQPAAPVLPPKPPAKPSTTPYAPPMTATYAQPTTAQQPLNYLGQMTSSIPSTGPSVRQPPASSYPTPPPPPPQQYGQPGSYNPSAYAQPTTPQTPYPPTSWLIW
ncbi:bck1-like resistance to osmotic shock [Ascosphaera atra]|nr:bck1-like resistance to osmotic shock [Ascosphaera atra]